MWHVISRSSRVKSELIKLTLKGNCAAIVIS